MRPRFQIQVRRIIRSEVVLLVSGEVPPKGSVTNLLAQRVERLEKTFMSLLLALQAVLTCYKYNCEWGYMASKLSAFRGFLRTPMETGAGSVNQR